MSDLPDSFKGFLWGVFMCWGFPVMGYLFGRIFRFLRNTFNLGVTGKTDWPTKM
jgi:hypothetical protein